MKKGLPNISVIVPTYRDWGRLRKCLHALASQTYDTDSYEVIVINNERTYMPLQDFVSDRMHFLIEEKKGSYAARNCGIKFATGNILAFTDSDCIPDTSWLENIAYEFQSGARRIAGKICLTYQSERLSLAEVYEKAFAFDQEHNAAMGISVTANMAVEASLFSKLGLFDENTESGGDVEWSKRAANDNIPIKYGEHVVVRHPARNNIKDILRKKNRVLRGKKSTRHPVYQRNIVQTLILSLLPPLHTARRLIRRKNVTAPELVKALSLLYVLKIYSGIYMFFLKYFHER